MSIAEFPSAPPQEPEPDIADLVPPQDLPAEQSVLGAMILSKDAIADVVEVLRADEFYRPAHQIIFTGITELFAKGEPTDTITVTDWLRRSGDLERIGGPSYIASLVQGVPAVANASHYAVIVHDKAVLRKLATAGTRIAQMAYAGEGDVEKIADRAQAEIFDATTMRSAEDYVPLAGIMEDAIAEIEGIASRGGQMVGVPTGFIDLDRLTNGLHSGQLVIVAARPAIGKALAVDTPIPTPDGWTAMGELRVGDRVFGPDGLPTKVVNATEAMLGRPCYMVEFSDGSSLVADGDHQWTVAGWGQPRTTEQLQQSLALGGAHPVLPAVSPLELAPTTLPIDPYALGVWLAHIGHEVPLDVQMHAEAAGGDLDSVAAAAARLGITRFGFIPPTYLRSSFEQRCDLLAGLLDVGASVAESGEIVFTTGSRPLAQGMYELLCTFGISASVSGHPPRHHGEPPEVWLTFTTDRSVFRVADKQLMHKRRLGDVDVPQCRRITAITAIRSVPVRCIEVDNASHLFLAGRAMVPTHNSTLGLDIARSAAIKNGLTTVIFSLEMGRNEIVMRLLSAEAQVALHHMRAGKLGDQEWRKIASREGALHDSPLFVDDSPNMTMTEIRAKCRRLKQRDDLRLVIIDYMQLMTSGKRVESRQQEVSEFSRSLKLLAKELEVPVIAISQLNRGPEARTDKKPMLSDLRESGSLEQDADMVILIHREDAYDKESARVGEADLIVAKHRNGPTDTITVTFQGHYSRFADMARE